MSRSTLYRPTLYWLTLTSVVALAIGSSTRGRAEQADNAPSFRKIQISDKFYCEGATCADINGDGHQDFIAGPYWFAGPQFTESHEYRPAQSFDIAAYSDNFFTFANDFNRDGRADILIVGMPGEGAYWFENPGIPSKTEEANDTGEHWPRRLVLAITDNESPALVDMDRDGRLDLLCQSEGRFGLVTVPSDATTSPWNFQPISPDLGYGRFTHGLGQGDLNNDGRTDLLEKNGWWEHPSQSIAGQVWEFHPLEFSAAGGAQMHAVDFDGDGDQDVLTSKAAHAYGLSWFENLSESVATEFREHVIMPQDPAAGSTEPQFSQLHAVAVADVNRDGIPDIVTGKRYWAHGGNDPGGNDPAVLYWYETVRKDTVGSSGGTVEFRPHLIDRNSGVGTQVEARDINGDGRVDVLVGNKKGLFVFLQSSE